MLRFKRGARRRILLSQSHRTRFGFVPYPAGVLRCRIWWLEISFRYEFATNSIQQVRAGSVKGFAVTANRRLSGLPEIPTVDEVSLPRFYFSQWFGLWAPKQTRDDIISNSMMPSLTPADPEVHSRVADVGQEFTLERADARSA